MFLFSNLFTLAVIGLVILLAMPVAILVLFSRTARLSGEVRALERRISHLPWAAPLDSRGGLQMAVRLTEGSERQQTHRAMARGIATPSLSELYHAAPPIAGWRLGFAALPPEAIESAVRALR